MADYYIKIDGTNASEAIYDDVEEIAVDSSLHLPDMFTIRLHDQKLNWADDSIFDIGKEVEISSANRKIGAAKSVLITGEITALEPHFAAVGSSSMVIRGYDKSHRLHRGRQTRTFLGQKDSAVANSIAGEAGLSADTDMTTVTYDYILQNNQTNMEFLLSRAERIGYQVFASDGKLHFKKGTFSLGDGPELVYADTLITFRPRWTASHQTDKMIVKGWDPKGKQQIEATKSPNSGLNQGGMQKPGGDAAKSAFSSAEAVVTDQPVSTPDEATALADGLSTDISREFVRAEGVCVGHPGVKAGWKVTISNVGKRFSGKYFVTSATHIITPEGYETRFSITGRQPDTLSHLLNADNGHGKSRGVVQGVVPALVTNLADPENLGRVKVKYAWLGEIESFWARIASPMAGAERGLFYLPEVNDEVLVAFEHGDVHRPYVVGCLWSSTDKPPRPNDEAVGGGKVNQRVLVTRQGHEITLDDSQGKEMVSVKSKSGHEVILDDTTGSENITIKDKTGSNSMVIDSTMNSMSIAVLGDFTVDAKGKVTITSKMPMSLETLATANIKATGMMTVEGTAGLTAKTTVAQVALTGPTVNINNGALEVM